MYTANKPIFEFLYAYIRENFSKETIEDDALVFGERPDLDDRFFELFRRGPFLLKDLPHTHYPCGWLEFGETTEIEFERAPEGYCYGLRYQMPIFLGRQQPINPGIVSLDTFRTSVDGILGVGDIISEIVSKAWKELHLGFATGGNFQFVDNSFYPVIDSSGKLRLSDVNWWVKKWSVDVSSDVVDIISEWQEVLDRDPRARAKIINWGFTIFEQEGLI